MIGRDSLSRFYREQVLPRLSVEDVFVDVRFGWRRGREWRAPCPLHDGRGLNFSVNTDELVWRCHSSCQAGGDAIAYLMRTESLDFRAAVHELARRVGVDTGELGGVTRSATARRPKPARPARPASPEPSYPPREEVEALWAACLPVTESPAVASWLRSKRIDPVAVVDMDLARAIGSAQFEWTRFRSGRSWHQQGQHLIVPQRDATGLLRSLVARNVLGRHPKSVGPTDCRRAGLVIACPLARQILAAGTRPSWWPSDVVLRIEVVEGEKKFLQRTLAKGDACEVAPAVIGIESGSWTSEIAARIPDGCTLYVATDPNGAGAGYAAAIVDSLAPRHLAGVVHVELREEFVLKVDPRGRLAVEVRE